jgi:hypothetical protein
MVASIYADVPKRLHALAEESVWSHLVKLEGESRVRRTDRNGQGLYEAPG